MSEVRVILGWDIGGVNLKVARVLDDGATIAHARPFELQRDAAALVRVLRELCDEMGVTPSAPFECAVTMTAELSQMFRTKREGVRFVLDAVETACPRADIHVFAADGGFLSPAEARDRPLTVAAANWAATARIVAARHRTALLVDIGTTTADIIPIVDGTVAAIGATDPDRLASGELVYSGAIRTPVEAIVRDVPYGAGRASVSAEGFALVGDVHLWHGRVTAGDYSVPTPDGRPASRDSAAVRLARVICADGELLDEQGVTKIADAIAAAQVETIASAVAKVASRHPSLRTAVVTGLGAFIAATAARAAGLDVAWLAEDIGDDAARYAPAAAVALLWAGGGPAKGGHHESGLRAGPAKAGHDTSGDPAEAGHDRSEVPDSRSEVDVVIKVGGGLLEHVEHLDRVLRAIDGVACAHRVLIVPGGGPFAETVRRVDERLDVGDTGAHWMAVLGMDQYAHLLVSRVQRAAIVWARDQCAEVVSCGNVAVLAPSRWLMSVDPLPHTWAVTSDSIAAWVAGELNARHLVLVKPPGARGPDLVDPWFKRALPPGVTAHCVDADQAIALLTQLTDSEDGGLVPLARSN